jgi:hypothetical protein
MEKDVVLKTFVIFNQLIRLIALEDSINVRRREHLMAYTGNLHLIQASEM